MTTSAYPVIWALKHAPVADAYERAVLLALADSGDPDGCDCYPSPETMTVIAKCDAQTVKDRCKSMQKRGLIRRQPQAPSKPGWLRIPRNRRPAVWELMIPYSWWSDEQRAEINRMRAERGANTEPITPETRPDLTPAPQRAPRADKGRTRAAVQPDEDPHSLWGVSQTPQVEPVENRPGGSDRPGLGGLQDPQPSRGTFLYGPSGGDLRSYFVLTPVSGTCVGGQRPRSGCPRRIGDGNGDRHTTGDTRCRFRGKANSTGDERRG